MEERELHSKNSGRHDPEGDVPATGPDERSKWEGLSAPPRLVPNSIRFRLMFTKVSAAIILLGVLGGICISGGMIVRWIADPTIPWLLGWGLLLSGVVLWLVAVCVLYLRVQRTVDILSRGQLLAGRITHVYDRSNSKYASYESLLEEFGELARSPYGSGVMGVMLSQQFRDWPVKILVEGCEGEIDARVDLGARMMRTIRDPRAQWLVDHHRGKQRVVMVEQFPWLRVSDAGELEYGVRQEAEKFGFGKSLGRAFLVVVLTYALVALSMSLNIKPLFNAGLGAKIPPALGAVVVLLFTLTHAVLPVFFYQPFASLLDSMKENSSSRFDPGTLFVNGFFYLHIGFWYCIPIIGLAALTGWLSLAWVVLDVLRAGPGQRRWAFLQHGSTSMALGLFVVCFSGGNLFPVGLLVVLLQALLLTVLEWKGKGLWVKEPDGG